MTPSLLYHLRWHVSLSILLTGLLFLLFPYQVTHAQVVAAVGNPGQLTTRTTTQFDPSISGEIVVYTDLSNGGADVYAYDLSTGTEHLIAGGSSEQQLQDVSGPVIVYAEQSPVTGVSVIMVYDYVADTYLPVPSSTDNDSFPAIDGNLIAFQGFGTSYDIYVYDRSVGATVAVTSTLNQHEEHPSISGQRVVFERHVNGSSWQVVVVDLATFSETVVATAIPNRPAPQIDGDTVVWVEGVSGEADIYARNLGSGETRRLILSGEQSWPKVSGDFVVFDDLSGTDIDVKVWSLKSDPSAPRVHRIPGVAGSVEFLNDVDGNRIAYTSDASGNFDIWMVELTVDNPPVADAGPNQSVAVGGTVTLDGTGSYDDITPTENLQYAWSFGLTPNDQLATMTGSDTATPQVTTGGAGDYELILVVTDEAGQSSAPDITIVSTVNVPPNADAGPDQGVVAGDLVTLDGSGSNDPDGDPISYLWSILSQPAGSLATLSGANTVSASFVADLPGTYTIQLVVNDGNADSAADEIIISAITNQVSAETNITDVLNVVATLPPGDVTSRGNQQALIQMLLKALDSLQDGDIDAATKKLLQAIERTDGCVLRGSPDVGGGGGGNPPAKDYVTDCAVQNIIYFLLVDALNSLTP